MQNIRGHCLDFQLAYVVLSNAQKKDPLIFSSVDNFKLKWLFWNALSRKRQREFDESYLFYKSLFSTVIKTLKDPQSSATIKIEQHESH